MALGFEKEAKEAERVFIGLELGFRVLFVKE